jgi:serine/threonine protein kinase
MAPELFNKRENIDFFSADIWSLGITFYKLFVGESPWPRTPNNTELIRAIVSMNLEIPESLPPGVRGILGRMILANPAARATAPDLLGDELFTTVEQRGLVGIRLLDGSIKRIARALTRDGTGKGIFLAKPTILNLSHIKRGSQQIDLGKMMGQGSRRFSIGGAAAVQQSTAVQSRKV